MIDDSKLSLDLLVETILTDKILLKDRMSEAITKAVEFLESNEDLTLRKNAVIVASKILCYDHGGLDEDIVTSCLEKFTSLLSDGDIQVKKVVAEYFGSIVLTLNLD